MRILGVSSFYHDSAAALVEDGKIVAAAQEERFTRKKHDSDFPARAIEYCLDQAGLDLDEVEYVTFYDKPFLKFERLLETYLAFAPKGFRSFRMAIPLWLREKLFLKHLLRNELREFAPDIDWEERLLFSEHHQSHAASRLLSIAVRGSCGSHDGRRRRVGDDFRQLRTRQRSPDAQGDCISPTPSGCFIPPSLTTPALR